MEQALICTEAFHNSIWIAYHRIASNNEVCNFKGTLKRKLDDIAKVAEKGVVLKEVTE